ncbi:MAG: ankyrin repeat domain-containing protein, partial [Gammaproteobacteria bacterium]
MLARMVKPISRNVLNLTSSSEDKALLNAAMYGDLEGVKKAIQAGANPNVIESELSFYYAGYSPLIYAARFGYEPIVNHLLEVNTSKPITFNRQTGSNTNNTALHWAAYHGRLSIVKKLHESCSETLYVVNGKDGFMPFHTAIAQNQLNVAQYFLENQTPGKPNLLYQTVKDGRTPFQIAYDAGHYLLAVYLLEKLEKGCDKTAYDAARDYAHKHTRNNHRGYSSFITGSLTPAETKLLKAAEFGNVEQARQALREGADINTRALGMTYLNYTAVIIAAKHGHVNLVTFLLENPLIDLRLRTYFNNTRNTALHWAARNGHHVIASKLMNKDKRPLWMAEDEFGFLPIHFAAQNGHEKICLDMVVFSDASLLLKCTKDRKSTPIHIAAQHGHVDLANQLLEKLRSAPEGKEHISLIDELSRYLQLNEILYATSSYEIDLDSLIRAWSQADAQEYLIMNDVLSTDLTDEKKEEFIKGGHLVIQDDGEFYQKWVAGCQNKNNRTNAS